MPKNEDGEFELILGNRQLLSVFFIVVVLLGVFFTMGYIVGRNSAPAMITDAEGLRKDTKPMVVDSAAPTPTPAAETPAPAATPEPTPVEQREAEAKPEPPKPSPAPASDNSPAAGQTYLQLAATTRHEADIEVDVLRKKGFKALDIENPDRPGLFRVLVGPIPEGGINKTKSDLNAAGFPGDRAIRRTF
ncbi:MAG TPA: SPOR domain-containing protein [Bryobacteraceae bacterium]|nr:SPOR domain-containing protein [Bryobacteraceae bacterium]